MDCGLKISVKRIRSDADQVEEHLESIPIFINELETAMQQLAQCWEGAAWIEYQNQVALYIEILTEIYKQMGEFTAKMNEASQIYERAEQNVCGKMDSVFVL